MSAERLREAAGVLRERAEAAMAPPVLTGTSLDDDSPTPVWFGDVNDWRDPGARYIVTMDPWVGTAVAAWLEQMVETFDADPSDYCGGNGHDGLPCNAWWCANVERALTVADAILGGAS